MAEESFKANVIEVDDNPILGKLKAQTAESLDMPTETASDKDNGRRVTLPKDGDRLKFLNSLSQYATRRASITGQPARDKNPIIPAEDINDDILQRELYKYGIVHDQLVYLQQIAIPDTPPNREFVYKKSDTAQVIVRMVAMTIVGDGVFVEANDVDNKEEIEESLNEFLQNLRGPLDDYNISDLIHDIIRDGVVHGYHVSALLRKKYVPVEEAYDLDVDNDDELQVDKVSLEQAIPTSRSIETHRLDMRSIQKATHPTTGALKFVQEVVGPAEIVTNKKFMSKDWNPTVRTIYGMTTDFDNSKVYRVNLKPKRVLYINLFREPPIAPVIDMIAHRTWLLWAQKKVGLKFAAPVPTVKVGTPEDFTEDLNTRLDELVAVSDYLSDMRFGDGLALDYNMEWVNTQNVSNVGFEFAAVIDSLDKRIALAIGSSMALFEASGAELATSRTIQDMFLRWVAGLKTKLERALIILCYKHLTARNIKFKKGDFGIKWSLIPHRMLGEMVTAVRSMIEIGLVRSMKEGRSMIGSVFDLEQIDDEDDKTINELQYDKAYSDAKGRMDAQVEGQTKLNDLDFKLQKKLFDAGITKPAAGEGTGGKSTTSKKTKPGQNDQGSTVGTTLGDRKRGPQPEGGTVSASKRDTQITG